MKQTIEYLQEELRVLQEQSKDTNQKVSDLQNFVDELGARHDNQEAYTSKDSVQIMNPLFRRQ